MSQRVCETCGITLGPSTRPRFCPSCRADRDRASNRRARPRAHATRRTEEPVLVLEVRQSEVDALAIFDRLMEGASR